MISSNRNLLLGLAGAFVTVLIWSSWLVATRFAMTSTVGLVETAVIRFSVPTLVWGALLFRQGFWPKGLGLGSAMTIILGAGIGFFVIAANGFRLAPVSDSAAMMAGMLPVYTAVLGYFVLNQRLSRPQVAGLGAITIGALSIAAMKITASFGVTTVGHAFFFTASFVWGLYTIAFRRSGLDPLYAAAFISFWSLIGALCLLPFYGFSLEGVTRKDLLVVVIFQGVTSGVVGFVSYGIAIRHLGPPLATAITATVPIIATLGGYLFLGERPGGFTWAAVGLVAVGVALVSGIVSAKRAKQSP